MGKSLAERAAHLTSVFPDKKIAVTTLRRLYMQHGIKKKKIKKVKVVPSRHKESYQKWKTYVQEKLAEVKDSR